jgi:hypothetical protein
MTTGAYPFGDPRVTLDGVRSGSEAHRMRTRTMLALTGPGLFALGYGATFLVTKTGALSLEAAYLVGYLGIAALVIGSALVAGRVAPERRRIAPLLAGVVLTVALGDGAPPDQAWFVACHGAALLGLGSLLGAALGREVVEPAHLWPLVLVASAADLFSVLAPAGVTRAILEGHGPVALSAVVLHFPVVSEAPPAPILGLGDLVFAGFLGGAAARLELPLRRSVFGLGVGFLVCLAGLMTWAVPLPALPFIGIGFAAAHGANLRPRGRDMALAAGIALLVAGVGLVALFGR